MFLRQINPTGEIGPTVATVRVNVFCLFHQRTLPLTYFVNHGGVCERRVSTCQHASRQSFCVFTWMHVWSHHLAAWLSGLDLVYVEVLLGNVRMEVTRGCRYLWEELCYVFSASINLHSADGPHQWEYRSTL